jgi:hypothetical protein
MVQSSGRRPEPGDFVKLPDSHLLRITEVAEPGEQWWFRAQHPMGAVILASNAELTWDAKQQVWIEPPTRYVAFPRSDERFVERRRKPRGYAPNK